MYPKTPVQKPVRYKLFMYEFGHSYVVGLSSCTVQDERWVEHRTTGFNRERIDEAVREIMFYVNPRRGIILGNGFPKDVEKTIWLPEERRTPVSPELFGQVKAKLTEPKKSGLIYVLD